MDSRLLAAVLLLATACAATVATLAPDSRANAIRGPAPELGDRCQRAADVMVQKGCQRERDKAQREIRSLSSGDGLCLDPILGLDMNNCRARTQVEEQDPTAVQLHLIEVDPSSSWAPKASRQLWFENAALVDLYLQEKGF